MAVVKLHKGGALRLDKSYNFIDKSPIVDQLSEWVRQSGMTYKELALRAGISAATINRLFMGVTMRPQARTYNALGRVFGKKLVWGDI